jgi:hypothetical protein
LEKDTDPVSAKTENFERTTMHTNGTYHFFNIYNSLYFIQYSLKAGEPPLLYKFKRQMKQQRHIHSEVMLPFHLPKMPTFQQDDMNHNCKRVKNSRNKRAALFFSPADDGLLNTALPKQQSQQEQHLQ